MVLINQCNQKIQCNFMNEVFYLMPYEEKNISFDVCETILTLSHLYKSSYGSCFELDDVFQIVITSSFTINGINNQSMIYITREKVHFELFYTYDRFFCDCRNCNLVDDIHQVHDLDILLDMANKKGKKRDSFSERLFDFFLIDSTFGGTTILFLLFKLIFWFNNWSLSWKYIIFFWIIGFGLQVLNEKILHNYIMKKEPQKNQDLKKFSSNTFIKNYFSNPKREWIGNDIEIN